MSGANNAARTTRSSSGMRVIEIPGGDNSDPLTLATLQSMMCGGFGAPLWEKLQQTHGTPTDEGLWAAVAMKISPGQVIGSRWVAKGKRETSVGVKHLYANSSIARDAQLVLQLNLEDFEFPTDLDTRNISSWMSMLDAEDLQFVGPEDTEEVVRTAGLLGRLVIIPVSTTEAELRVHVLPMSRQALLDKIEAANVSLADPVIPTVTVWTEKVTLVPRVTEERGATSGFGFLPMLWTDAMANIDDGQIPSTANIKEEFFKFLRRIEEPIVLASRSEWAKRWKSEWVQPRKPATLWPLPPAGVVSVNPGMIN